ncbi:HdeD family acid-resistance protein [Leptolyngbyaceae cyanobacterium UHCC 1019]
MMEAEVIRKVRQNSGWFIALGVVMLLLGLAAIVEPFMATVAVARVFSWIFLFAGIIRIVYAIQSRQDRGFLLKLLIGILYVITGILLLSNVFGAALTLTVAFGIAIVGQGILEVIAAFKARPEANWVWTLVSGLLAIVLGILIFYQWPFSAAWILGVFVGINLMFTGVWMIVIPWAVRHNYRADM